MTNKTSFKNINEFLFQENKTFLIPNYQRGYKWSVRESENDKTAVEQLMIDLKNAGNQQQYFLQGVTVVESENNIILIDGQQRTTTLYLLLWCLGNENISNIDLQYAIRENSKKFISKLRRINDVEPIDKKDPQDIFYFKKAIEQIRNNLPKENEKKNEFKDFILSRVTILYIVIAQDKATKTFTMMNGSKATMLQEELVKAEMLRRISLPDKSKKIVSSDIDENLSELKQIISNDWEMNVLRSRYAREWDKWLYWWNKDDVQEFFGVQNPLGLLLMFYNWYSDNNKSKFSFEVFKSQLDETAGNKKQKTKLIFKKLRDLQKSFEDIFNIPKVHNYLKMSLLCGSDQNDKFEIIKYYMEKKNEKNIVDDYAKWRLIGATHRQITKTNELKDDENTKESRAINALNVLDSQFVYGIHNDLAIKQLLRLNVEEDNRLNRKFDFSIYGNKSLEHIHPKSKTYYKKKERDENDSNSTIYYNGNGEPLDEEPTGDEWVNRDEMGQMYSEHCIGNLVLLDKNENSKFSNKPFSKKKEIYFNVKDGFKSRHLLHTITVFASDIWGIKKIQENKKRFIEKFKKDYNLELNENGNNE